VVERVSEPVLFDPQPWVTYRLTEETGRGGPIERSVLFGIPGAPVDMDAPLRHRLRRPNRTY
jgi:hypothetical protein